MGGQAFIDDIRSLATDSSILTLNKVFHFTRRARDYQRLYMNIGVRDGDSALTHDEIEFLRKKAKTHRSCGEGCDGAFVRQQYNI